MLRIVWTIALIFGLSGTVAAQEAPNAGIAATITNQIDAFRADDFARAFTYASPNIQGLFQTPENFGTMVRNGFPMVHRPMSVRMLELREVAGRLWQRVMVTDQAGNAHVLDYQMVETPDGWQINGVQLLPQAGVGA
jgi:hypothetical protein